MKNEASLFTNKKLTAKNARGSKTPPMKKEALCFTNKKCTPKSHKGLQDL
jgi:hypothetical protein